MNVLSNANAAHPNANSNMNSNWSTPKEIRFSREALLARFDHEASPPSDLDPNLSIFSIAALEPMANLPLTELEKKILSLGSVNSETGPRRNYSGRSVDDKGGYQRNIVSSRGGRGGSVRRASDRNLGRKNDGDASPDRSTSDLNVHDESSIVSDEKGILRSYLEKKGSGVDILGSGSFSSSPLRQPSTMSMDGGKSGVLSDIFGGLSIASEDPYSAFGNSSILTAEPHQFSVGQRGTGVNSGLGGGLIAPPGMVPDAVPSSWFYRDPMGNTQGPFSTDQMQDWYSKSFFSEDLPIKREKDLLYEPLSNLLSRFGRDRPFVDSDSFEYNTLVQQAEQSRFRLQSAAPGTPGLSQKDSAFGVGVGTGYSPFASVAPQRYNSTPTSFLGNDYVGGVTGVSRGVSGIRFGDVESLVTPQNWAAQGGLDTGINASYTPIRSATLGFSSFGAPDLAYGQPTNYGNTVLDSQHVQPAFSQFSVVPQFGSLQRGGSDVVASPTRSVGPSAWHSVQPVEPTPTGDFVEIPQETQFQPELKPEPVQVAIPRIPTPEPSKSPIAISPAKSVSANAAEVVEPEPAVAKQQKVKPKKSQPLKKAAAVSQAAASALSPAESLSEPVTTPVEAAPLPVWGSGENTPKLSLKEIQELEQREFEHKERERARKAHVKMMAEAQALAEQGANSAIVAGGGTAWTAGQAAKKPTLADIMAEEERQRKSQEVAAATVSGASSAGVVGGAKRYADYIAPTSGYVPPATVRTGLPAPSVPAVPKAAQSSGWNVVGKVQPKPTPAAVTPASAVTAKAAAPPKPYSEPAAAAVKAPSSRPADGGPSVGFLQWTRQALKPLERSTTAGVKVDEFIQILLMIPMNEPRTVSMICDDTLGGLTAIDPLKFAEEFMRRRRADASNDPAAYAPSVETAGSRSNESSASGFVVVQKKKGKK
ncbi:hypothetical protein CcCBS67573_g06281 [Chytriomyces confervae]|uniref:GYF domain-containing protein n=1 Tax=Chytriomyces confervae TaxID=246404 RepID=A0A507F6K3_9FUNG|nr:hypothetical protein CcCBS67573_g06281 [Chytriomyces confervae]